MDKQDEGIRFKYKDSAVNNMKDFFKTYKRNLEPLIAAIYDTLSLRNITSKKRRQTRKGRT